MHFCPVCFGPWQQATNKVKCQDCSYTPEPDSVNLQIEPSEAKTLIEKGALLVDVRLPWENQLAAIPGNKLIPLQELPKRFNEIDKTKLVITHCHHGVRALHAARFLKQHGFNVRSLVGGTERWSREIDASVPEY